MFTIKIDTGAPHSQMKWSILREEREFHNLKGLMVTKSAEPFINNLNFNIFHIYLFKFLL